MREQKLSPTENFFTSTPPLEHTVLQMPAGGKGTLVILYAAAYEPWAYRSSKGGLRRAYKRRGLYPRGLITGIEKGLRARSQSSSADQYTFFILYGWASAALSPGLVTLFAKF